MQEVDCLMHSATCCVGDGSTACTDLALLQRKKLVQMLNAMSSETKHNFRERKWTSCCL